MSLAALSSYGSSFLKPDKGGTCFSKLGEDDAICLKPEIDSSSCVKPGNRCLHIVRSGFVYMVLAGSSQIKMALAV
jgi:hypothetical protein